MLVVAGGGGTTQAIVFLSESVFFSVHTVPFLVIESNERHGHGGDQSLSVAGRVEIELVTANMLA